MKGSPVPWKFPDAVVLACCTFVGLSLVLFAWYGASGSDHMSTQVAWTDAGVVGALVAGIGNITWILSGRRAVGLRRAEQMQRLERLIDGALLDESGATDATREIPVLCGVVAVRSLSLYHRPDCPLVGGRRVSRFDPSSNGATGKEPCGVCLP